MAAFVIVHTLGNLLALAGTISILIPLLLMVGMSTEPVAVPFGLLT
jgi:hypothetical protein